MKKAIQANIHDRIFYIDEDAYTLLQNYLHQLSATFPDAEGQEIVSDIETRISELFEERRAQGYNVIDIAYVNQVIDTVGRPEDLSDNEYVSEEGKNDNRSSTPPPYTNSQPEDDPKKKFYRDIDNKVLGGVLSGIAKYLNWDVNILRILFVFLLIFSAFTPWAAFWPWIIAYLICWMVIPPADTPRRRLEMEGREVTVENIGNDIKEKVDKPSAKSHSSFGETLGTIVNVTCKLFLVIIGVGAGFAGLGLIIGFLFFLFMLLCVGIMGIEHMDSVFNVIFSPALAWQCLAYLLMFLGGILLLGSIVWAICSAIFNWGKAKRSTWVSLLILFVIVVATAIMLLFYLISAGYGLELY